MPRRGSHSPPPTPTQVYVGQDSIDADLVTSIATPAQNPNAAEVFYRVITASGESMNSLLGRLHKGTRVLLLWGSKVQAGRAMGC